MNNIWNNNNFSNNMNYTRLPFANNPYNLCMNYCHPQIMPNGLYNNIGFSGLPMINNRNNFVQYC